MSCEYKELEDTCDNSGIECDFCHFNPGACTQDFYTGELDSSEFEPLN